MIWLSTEEVAELLGYEKSTIRKKSANGEYICRYISSNVGRGGKKMEILLESLPEQAQKAYHNASGESQIVVNTTYTSTKEQRKKGELRALAITEYRKFSKQCISEGIKKKTEIMDLFVKKWNDSNDFQISKKSLYDWMKKTKTGNVEKLVDKRGGYNRGQTTIPEKYSKLFDSLYRKR